MARLRRPTGTAVHRKRNKLRSGLFGGEEPVVYVKDAFHAYVIQE